MKNYKLTPILSFPEISGASGLYYIDKQVFIISDDSLVMYQYDMEREFLFPISFLKSGELQEQIEKSLKPDFEAITFHNSKLFLFGSGSDRNRFKGIKYDLISKEVEKFSPYIIYSEMMRATGIDEKDLNIEGAIIIENDLYLYNRGNGPEQKNGVFIIKNWENRTARECSFQIIGLPTIHGRVFTFSDAIFWNDKILFLATAENTDNTYDDGEVLGSAIGTMNPKNFTIEEFQIITIDYKLEGITAYKKTPEYFSFLVCDDSDDIEEETHVFELKLYR